LGFKTNTSFNIAMTQYVDVPGGRNRRTVWEIATQPYSGPHYATFPPRLVEPMILTTPTKVCAGKIVKLRLRRDLPEDRLAEVTQYLQEKGLDRA